jgi:hypothetical protein
MDRYSHTYLRPGKAMVALMPSCLVLGGEIVDSSVATMTVFVKSRADRTKFTSGAFPRRMETFFNLRLHSRVGD